MHPGQWRSISPKIRQRRRKWFRTVLPRGRVGYPRIFPVALVNSTTSYYHNKLNRFISLGNRQSECTFSLSRLTVSCVFRLDRLNVHCVFRLESLKYVTENEPGRLGFKFSAGGFSSFGRNQGSSEFPL